MYLAMKADRKRFKGEKLDLLNQMKQLYSTLEDKESELREFIRTYEQKMKETQVNIKQVRLSVSGNTDTSCGNIKQRNRE